MAGGTLAGIAQPMLRMLVAMLAIAPGRVVSDEALVDALWGEEWSRERERNLHSHVSAMRRLLAAAEPGRDTSRLVRSGSGYRLDVSGTAVDAGLFGSLAARGRTAVRDGDMAAALTAFADLTGQADAHVRVSDALCTGRFKYGAMLWDDPGHPEVRRRASDGLAHAERALALHREQGNPGGAMWALLYTCQANGDLEGAIACFLEALDIVPAIGPASHGVRAETLAELGETYQATGDWRSARQAWRQAWSCTRACTTRPPSRCAPAWTMYPDPRADWPYGRMVCRRTLSCKPAHP